jgi:hypothetical protein
VFHTSIETTAIAPSILSLLGLNPRALDSVRIRGTPVLPGILQLIPDSDDPHAIAARLTAAFSPRSWLAVYHPASDIDQERVDEAVRRVNARSAGTTTLRSHAEIARFFDGLEVLKPGLVQVHRWQPGWAAPADGGQIAPTPGWRASPDCSGQITRSTRSSRCRAIPAAGSRRGGIRP